MRRQGLALVTSSWTDRLPVRDSLSQPERARALADVQTQYVAVWRDRRWARLCVVCGGATTETVEYLCGDLSDYLLPRELQSLRPPLPDYTGQVPACFRHLRRRLWPVRVSVAVYDVLLVDRIRLAGQAAASAAAGFTVRNDEGIGL